MHTGSCEFGNTHNQYICVSEIRALDWHLFPHDYDIAPANAQIGIINTYHPDYGGLIFGGIAEALHSFPGRGWRPRASQLCEGQAEKPCTAHNGCCSILGSHGDARRAQRQPCAFVRSKPPPENFTQSPCSSAESAICHPKSRGVYICICWRAGLSRKPRSTTRPSSGCKPYRCPILRPASTPPGAQLTVLEPVTQQ